MNLHVCFIHIYEYSFYFTKAASLLNCLLTHYNLLESV